MMLLTQAHYNTARTFLTGPNITTVAQKVLNATVKLQGPATGGQTFTGSATILGAGTEVAYTSGKWTPTGKQFTVVMTCKHSLYIQGNNAKVPMEGQTAVWDEDLVDGFKAASIFYSTSLTNAFGDDLTKTAAIDHVVPIFEENIGTAGKMIAIPAEDSSDGTAFQLVNLTGTTTPNGGGSTSGSGGINPAEGAVPWAYDVMILLSKDAGLYSFATTPGACDFQAGATQANLTTMLSAQYTKATKYQPLVPALSRELVQIGQTGFGKPSDQLAPRGKPNDPKITLPALPNAGAQYQRLQYKLSPPIGKIGADVLYSVVPGDTGDLTLTSTHCFMIDCDGGNNSTNSGDSGGGVFAFPSNPASPATKAYLIGVTTGSAYSPDEGGAAGMWDFDNNVVTSLGPYYANLFDLRYQNV